MNELKPEDVMKENDFLICGIPQEQLAAEREQALREGYEALLREKDAEIERLKQENKDLHDNIEVIIEMVSIARSEAIDEFEKKLMEKKCYYTETENTFDFDGVTVEDIEQTEKELKGATDGKSDL